MIDPRIVQRDERFAVDTQIWLRLDENRLDDSRGGLFTDFHDVGEDELLGGLASGLSNLRRFVWER